MATIKAGTYRFNDVLTPPSEQLTVEAYAWQIADVVADGAFGFAVVPTSDGMIVAYVIPSVSTNPVYIYVDGDEYENALGFAGWVDESYKTITIPNDTEVSFEFLTWFSANAVEQKQISGKWKFNDVPVFYNIEALSQTVNFHCTVDVYGVTVTCYCSGVYTLHLGYGLIGYVVQSMIPDYSSEFGIELPYEFPVHHSDGWEFDAKIIDFGTEPQTVSAEFYNWLTANATQPMASVSHNGAEIASLFPGQTATLKCAGMKMDGDVVVSVAEQNEPVLQEKTVTENGEVTPDAGYDGLSKVTVAVESNGIAINGIIEQYKVNAGATVNAGDFVEFVKKCGEGVFHNGTTSYLSACKLDNNRVLVAYQDTGNINRGTVVVLTIDDGSVTVGTEIVFNTFGITYTSVVALSSTKAMVLYEYNDYGYAMVLTIDGTTISCGSATKFCDDELSSNMQAVALTDSKVLVAYHYYDSYYFTTSVVLTVSGTSITVNAKCSLVSKGSSSDRVFSLVKLNDSSAIVQYGSNYRVAVLAVDGTTISSGSYHSLSYRPYLTALSDTEMVLVYKDTSTGSLTAFLYSISGVALTKVNSVTFAEASATINGIATLSETKALVTLGGNAFVLTVDGDTISAGAEVPFTEYTGVNYLNIVPFSATSAFIAFVGNGLGTYASLTIDGDTITVADASGTFVQPATGRLHNVGIAATSGAGGETVDVYVVG